MGTIATGLMGVLSRYNLSKRTKPLIIFGPKGLDEIITTQFRWSNTKLSYPLTYVRNKDWGLESLAGSAEVFGSKLSADASASHYWIFNYRKGRITKPEQGKASGKKDYACCYSKLAKWKGFYR